MSLATFRVRVLSVVIVLAGLVGVSFAAPALAANTPNGSTAGIGLKPALIQDTVDPGSHKDYTISITNLSNARQTYYLDTRDITSVDAGGVPIYAKPNAPKTGFEMSSWVTLSAPQVTLNPQQEQQVKVSVDVPKNASPGSHFSAVFVSMVPPKLRQNGASVGYDVANIISLRVSGDAVVNAQIRQFSTSNYIYGSSQVTFMTQVANKGTVLLRPFGPIEIYNMFGKRVALLTMNQKQDGIFPGKVREFDLTWDNGGPGFGRYQAVMSLVYGEQGKRSTISSTISFWILPMNIILPAIGVLAFLLLAVYAGIRMYVRSKLRGIAGGSRRIRRRRQGGISALLLVTIVMLAVTALFLLALLALFS